MDASASSQRILFVALLLALASLATTQAIDQLAPIARQSKKCPAIRKCLKLLDDGKTCPILPVPRRSLTPPVPFQTFKLTKLRKGVWAYDDGAYLSLILKLGTRLALIDFPDNANSNLPNGTMTRLTEATEQILDGTVPKRIDMVYSHAHFDHIGAGTRFFNYAKSTYPDARIFIWGTKETKDLIERSETKRAIVPNVIVGKEGRTLSLGRGLDVKMEVVGGHTVKDLRLLIPRFKDEAAVLMYIDVIFPGWTPPILLALTEDVGRYIEAQEDILKLDFDILVPGHVRLGTKKDVRRNLRYTKDLVEAAKAGIASITNEALIDAGILKISDPEAVEFGNIWFGFIGIQRTLEINACVRIMLEKWGCRLGGLDFTARGHCLTAINYVLLDL